MLDLGDTEEQIAEKTGFSKTTIRRRLNIAKLNQDELKKKEQDENFQLTLKDLYELEKVKDIKTRDKILREATSSRDLVSRAQAAAAEAKRNENAKKLKEMLKKKEEGGRHTPFHNKYRPQFYLRTMDCTDRKSVV